MPAKSAGQNLGLGGVGGFSSSFMKMGASGVIAPLWRVDDALAKSIAHEIYQRVSKPPVVTFAEAVRAVRAKVYEGPEQGKTTYAAYCFYGDPCASLEPTPSANQP